MGRSSGSFDEAIMVTDLFKIETDAKLAASDKYHERVEGLRLLLLTFLKRISLFYRE